MDTAMVCCSVFDGQIDGSCIRSFIHSLFIYSRVKSMIHDGSLGLEIKYKVKTRRFWRKKRLKAKLSDGDDVITLCSQMAPTDKNAAL